MPPNQGQPAKRGRPAGSTNKAKQGNNKPQNSTASRTANIASAPRTQQRRRPQQKQREDDEDDPFASSQPEAQPADRAASGGGRGRAPASRMDVDDDDVDDDDNEDEGRNRDGDVDGDEDDEDDPRQTIPPELLTRILHEFFEKDGTRVSKGANDAVARYMDVFVREAIARCAVEKGGEGFLEVRDLERIAPQLLLDL